MDVLGELATVNDTPLWWDSAAGSLDVIAIGDTPLLRTPGGITGVGDQWNIPGWRSERDTLHGDPWTANHATGPNAGTSGDAAGAGGGDPFAGLSLPDGLALTTSGAVTIGGLEWMGHRAYDPTTRGFLSTDPLPPIPGTSWAANPYAFAGNDPVHALDPTGLSPITDTQLQAYRDGNHGVFAAAGDWLAHNWEYLAGAAMVIGGGALMLTGIGGPIGGMLIAAGADVIIQKATTGSMDWTETAITAATGGLGELAAGTRVVTAIAGTGLRGAVTTGAVAGGVSGAAANAANYAISPGPHTIDGLMATTAEGALTGGTLGAAGGAAGAALARGTGAALTAVKSSLNNIKSVLSTKTTHIATTALEDIHPTPITSPHRIDISDYTQSKTVLNHSSDLKNNGDFARPYNESRLTMQEIINGGVEIPDRKPHLRKFIAEGGIGQSAGIWEIVIDPEKKMVVHFLYSSKYKTITEYIEGIEK
ncbi:RHS repeat-associated core domain-containing protein [Rathayibacter toxicus]|uniref:RHS repeat-associated core domain-containing protein n=1 Tax=Rathayibacter toxicus TaxID=145458 RepID=UPI001C03B974|nr:RHS repeat-associated core domain-containing protein [Rathayibacter toxicus]QWL30584.1 hypothetical protein E2R34_07465 [Rathayibacter toxicus]